MAQYTQQQYDDLYNKASAGQKATLKSSLSSGAIKITPSTPAAQSGTPSQNIDTSSIQPPSTITGQVNNSNDVINPYTTQTSAPKTTATYNPLTPAPQQDNRQYITAGIDNQVFKSPDSTSQQQTLSQKELSSNQQSTDTGNNISPSTSQEIATSDYNKLLDSIAQSFKGPNGETQFQNYAEFQQQYGKYLPDLSQFAADFAVAQTPQQKAQIQQKLEAFFLNARGTTGEMGQTQGLEQSLQSQVTPESWTKVSNDWNTINQKLQEGKSIEQITQETGLDGKYVSDLISGRAEDYLDLTDAETAKRSQDIELERKNLQEQTDMAMQQLDSDSKWVFDQYATNKAKQEEMNNVNQTNLSRMIGRMGGGVSTGAIDGINRVQQQGQDALDELFKTYEHGAQEINDAKLKLAQSYQYNNAKLTNLLQTQLDTAKNNYFQSITAIQAKYGDINQKSAENIMSATNDLIKTTNDIYDDNLKRQQDLLNQFMQIRGDIRDQETHVQNQQKSIMDNFKEVSGGMTRNDITKYVKDNNLPPQYVDILDQQQLTSAVNGLNSIKGLEAASLGTKFSTQLEASLAAGLTPTQAAAKIANSAEFKQAIQSIPMTPQQQIDYQKSVVDLQKGQLDLANAQEASQPGTPSVAPVPSSTVDSALKTWTETQKVGSQGGQCGSFVNNYLNQMGISDIFVDPIDKKKAYKNSDTPTVGSVAIMDSPSFPEYGHVAIVESVNQANGTMTLLQSNGANNDEKVFRSTVPISAAKYGFFDPRLGKQGDVKPLSDDQRVVYNNQLSSFRSNPTVKAFEEGIQQYQNILSSLSDKSGPGDIAAIYQWMKSLDPNSVVREGEFNIAAKSAGVAQYLGNTFNRLENGEKLTDDQRDAFAKLAQVYIQNAGKNYDRLYDDFKRVTDNMKIDPSYLPTRASDQLKEVSTSSNSQQYSDGEYNVNGETYVYKAGKRYKK